MPGAVLFVVGYSGCDPATPAALYTAAVVVSGATAAGAYSSAVDVAPNFAGTEKCHKNSISVCSLLLANEMRKST